MKSPSIALVLFISLAIALIVTPRAMPPVAFAGPTVEEQSRTECDGYLQMALELGSISDIERLIRSAPCVDLLSPSAVVPGVGPR